MYSYFMFPTNVLNALTYPLCVWYYYVALFSRMFLSRDLFLLPILLFLESLLDGPLWIFALAWYLLQMFQTSSTSFGVEQMVCALCDRVLITLYLAAILWLLSHGRYRSVCVGFLDTSIVKVQSASGLMVVSRKGMEPSSLASSTVNWMEGSTVLM